MPSQTPIRFYISQIYIIYSLQQVHAYFQWLVVQISVYSVYEFIPPSCLEWHFFLCIFTLFFLDQAFVAWLFWMVLKSSPCERCLFPITRHLTDSDLNFNEALARSRVSVPLVRQPSPECAQSTTVTLLLGYASIFPPFIFTEVHLRMWAQHMWRELRSLLPWLPPASLDGRDLPHSAYLWE